MTHSHRPTISRQVSNLVAKVCGSGHTYTVGSICPTCLAGYLDKGGSLD